MQKKAKEISEKLTILTQKKVKNNIFFNKSQL